MGRAGSTLAMTLLGSDERCAFDHVYPMESRYLSRIVSFGAEWSGWTFERSASGQPVTVPRLGTHPVLLRQGAESAQLIDIPNSDGVVLTLWDAFEQSVRSGRPAAQFYAEKVAEWVPIFLAKLMPAYGLYLFRDPRDLFLSANAMNSRRGYLAFGRQPSDSDYDHALTIAFRYLHYYENYKVLRSGSDMCSLVLYEELVRDPGSVLADLTEKTGLRIEPSGTEGLYRQHRTSESVQASIGRWQQEPISAEVLCVFEEALCRLMSKLGYEASQSLPSLNEADLEFTGEQSNHGRLLAIEHADQRELGPCGLVVTTNGDSFFLVFSIPELPAASVKEMWLCFSGLSSGDCEISWSDSKGDFSPARSLTQKFDVVPYCGSIRLKVADHDHWTGTVSRVRVKFSRSVDGPSLSPTFSIRWLRLIPQAKLSSTATVCSTSPGRRAQPAGRFLRWLTGRT